ncbi:MAG TPA: hypothetical protein VHY21_17650 [Pseudonocardiaceae bacterium]|jgi:hypothetical protein|nr:hypothetical protein [Pseudonocardiaceae bacterium]
MISVEENLDVAVGVGGAVFVGSRVELNGMAAHASQTSCRFDCVIVALDSDFNLTPWRPSADTELINRTDRCSVAYTATDERRQHEGHGRGGGLLPAIGFDPYRVAIYRDPVPPEAPHFAFPNSPNTFLGTKAPINCAAELFEQPHVKVDT